MRVVSSAVETAITPLHTAGLIFHWLAYIRHSNDKRDHCACVFSVKWSVITIGVSAAEHIRPRSRFTSAQHNADFYCNPKWKMIFVLAGRLWCWHGYWLILCVRTTNWNYMFSLFCVTTNQLLYESFHDFKVDYFINEFPLMPGSRFSVWFECQSTQDGMTIPPNSWRLCHMSSHLQSNLPALVSRRAFVLHFQYIYNSAQRK